MYLPQIAMKIAKKTVPPLSNKCVTWIENKYIRINNIVTLLFARKNPRIRSWCQKLKVKHSNKSFLHVSSTTLPFSKTWTLVFQTVASSVSSLFVSQTLKAALTMSKQAKNSSRVVVICWDKFNLKIYYFKFFISLNTFCLSTSLPLYVS